MPNSPFPWVAGQPTPPPGFKPDPLPPTLPGTFGPGGGAPGPNPGPIPPGLIVTWPIKPADPLAPPPPLPREWRQYPGPDGRLHKPGEWFFWGYGFWFFSLDGTLMGPVMGYDPVHPPQLPGPKGYSFGPSGV